MARRTTEFLIFTGLSGTNTLSRYRQSDQIRLFNTKLESNTEHKAPGVEARPAATPQEVHHTKAYLTDYRIPIPREETGAMNSTNQTLGNSTLPPSPVTDPPISLPPFMIFLQTTFPKISLVICLFDFLVLIIVCAKGIYKIYPSVLLRWVLYCDVLLYLYYFLENTKGNALYNYLKVRPTDYSTCILATVGPGNISRSIMFLTTCAVYSIFQVTGSISSIVDSDKRRKLKILCAAFWGFYLFLMILTFAGGFNIVNGRCRIAVHEIRQIRFYTPMVILSIQGILLLGICYNLVKANRRLGSIKSKRTRICSIPRKQVFMVVRFLIIFISQIVRFVPGQLSIFANMRIDFTLLLSFALAGGVIDGISALTNRKIIGGVVKFPKYLLSTKTGGTTLAPTRMSRTSKVEASELT